MYNCFVIMPFKAELYYFYLYMKDHIKNNHPIDKCERGDSTILTSLLLHKIINYIKDADVIIADISGQNPNVFYELGIAQDRGKQVILITQDEIDKVPTDIKGFESIHYTLDDTTFLSKLDNALHNVFVERYATIYRRAVEVYNNFIVATSLQGLEVSRVSEEVFVSRVKDVEGSQRLPSMDDDNELNIAKFVLPKIIFDPDNISVMNEINNWLLRKLQHMV